MMKIWGPRCVGQWDGGGEGSGSELKGCGLVVDLTKVDDAGSRDVGLVRWVRWMEREGREGR